MVGDESLGKLARESKRYIWHTTSAQFAERRFHGLGVGSRTIGYLKTSVRCCMAERYFEKFWQHGKPVPRSCHADQSS